MFFPNIAALMGLMKKIGLYEVEGHEMLYKNGYYQFFIKDDKYWIRVRIEKYTRSIYTFWHAGQNCYFFFANISICMACI